jgi:uncharacterized membrane protein (UPF0127 family)
MVAARMKTLAALLVMVSGLLSGCNEKKPPGFADVTINGEVFHVEIALTSAQIEHGMMERTAVATNGGMLFVFPEAQVREFWMKNCLVSLDTLFMDNRGRIVHLVTMTPPAPGTPDARLPGYSSRWPARFVLELKEGTIQRLKVKEGDVVEMAFEDLKQLTR